MIGRILSVDTTEMEFLVFNLKSDPANEVTWENRDRIQIVELDGIYRTIAEELANQHSLAYTPVNGRADGTFRKLSVRVPNRPEFRLRTRTGYTAEMDGSVVNTCAPQRR